VAPPTQVFLNSHYCQPLINIHSSSVKPAVHDEVEAVTPRLSPSDMPKRLQVEYLPVEREGGKDEGAMLFAKTATQFYFK
jgi:hypothetical protein